MGEKFWGTLANDDKLVTLTDIKILDEKPWFSYHDKCVAPLLIVLKRQTNLTRLEMKDNNLAKSQRQSIR